MHATGPPNTSTGAPRPAFGTRPAERLVRHGAAIAVLVPGFAWVAVGDTRGVAAIVTIVVVVGGATSWALEGWRPTFDRIEVVVRYLWVGPVVIALAVLASWPVWDGYALAYAPAAALMGLLLVPSTAALAVTLPTRAATALTVIGAVVATALLGAGPHLHRSLAAAATGMSA